MFRKNKVEHDKKKKKENVNSKCELWRETQNLKFSYIGEIYGNVLLIH